jgi:hypothetical protein
MMLGPAPILALLVGLAHAAIYVAIRGHAGGRLPLIVVGAVLGAWAGDAIGGRLRLDLLLIGDFRVVAASVVAWLGIGFVTVISTLGPQSSKPG